MNDPATRRTPRARDADAHTLGGRYVAEQELARGGMATVYIGRDTVLQRPVAIKILQPEPAGGPQDAFLREARAAAALRHPHIVDVYDAGIEGDVPYIVMEYVPGETLRDLIAREAPVEPLRAASIVAAIADALDYAHRRGVVHCDVKPGNVLLPAEDTPKIVDFGIAHAGSATATFDGMIAGTAGYISPEQVEGQEPDGRADVYSLAAVLYEMLTGAPPFEGRNLAAVAAQRLTRPPVSPRERNPSVPPHLSDIVMHSLARERGERFASAAEFGAALRSFAAGVTQHVTRRVSPPSGARPEPRPYPPSSADLPRAHALPAPAPPPATRRRSPWPWLAVLGALAAVAVAAGVLLTAGVFDSGGGAVAVPDVLNRPLNEAADSLHDAGLNVAVELRQGPQPFGTVTEQQPPAGERLESKSDVRVAVSVGP